MVMEKILLSKLDSDLEITTCFLLLQIGYFPLDDHITCQKECSLPVRRADWTNWTGNGQAFVSTV